MSNEAAIRAKVEKKYDLFTSTVQSMSVEEMKGSLLNYAKEKEKINSFVLTCPDIIAAGLKVKELSSPFDQKIKEYKVKLSQLKKFIDDDISKEELDRVMSEYARLLEQEKLRKLMDRDLNEAKTDKKELIGGPNDTLSALKDKMAYLNIILK